MQPLLHLVGILFPHINDDARSKSHQILTVIHIQSVRSQVCTSAYRQNVCERSVMGGSKPSTLLQRRLNAVVTSVVLAVRHKTQNGGPFKKPLPL